MFENPLSADEHPLDAIRHERLRRLHAYWESERRPARWLAYDRLRPEEIAYALSDVAVLEKGEGGGELQLNVRLAGETIRVEGVGLVRGASSADFWPSWFRAHMIESCREAFARAEPVYATVRLRCRGAVHAFERLLLPLVRRGPEPDCLLMAAVLPQALIDLKATLKDCTD
jgi:hypothetical protein